MLKKASFKLLSIVGFMALSANLFAAPDPIHDVDGSGYSAVQGQVTLTWKAPDPNDLTSGPSGYVIKVSTIEIDSYTNWGPPPMVGVDSIWTSTYSYTLNNGLVTTGNQQSVTLTGLYPGIPWFFAVEALNNSGTPGTWEGNIESGGNNYNPYAYAVVYSTNPVPVTGLNLDYGNNFINISWQANTELDIQNYVVQCSSYSFSVGFSTIAVILSPGTTHQNTGLVNGNTYYYRVRATDVYGHIGAYSDWVSTRPWINLDAPTFNYTSTAISSTSINWLWNSLPGSTSGYCVLTSTFGVLYQSTTTTDTYWIQHNLTPNASSTIFLQVYNGFCTTNSTTSLTHYTFAIEPVNISTSAISSRFIDLTWQNGANSSDTRYTISRSTDNFMSNIVLLVTSSATTTFNNTGLVEGTTYQYSIWGVNNENTQSVGHSTFTAATLRIPPGQPSFSGTLCTPGSVDGKVDLVWSTSRDDGGDPTTPWSASYLIKWSTASIYSDSDFTAIPPSASELVPGIQASAMAGAVTGLYPGTTYYFAIKAIDADSNYSAMSDTVSIASQDLPPGTPGTVSAIVISSVSIKVSWTKPTITANAYDDIAQYVIYRATYSFAGFQAGVSSITVSIPTTYYIDAGVNQKTTYYYRLSALDLGNATGYFTGFVSTIYESSALSSIANTYVPDTIAPDGITLITASPGSAEGMINLAWTSTGNDGSVGDITGGAYKIRYATYTPVFWDDSASNWTDFKNKYQIAWSSDIYSNTPQAYTLTGLTAGVTYYIDIWTRDQIGSDINSWNGNWSSFSNITSAWAQYDILPPASITDLAAVPLWRRVALSWTAPGEDGETGNFTGTYEIKTTNTGPIIDTTTWNNATGYPYSSIIISTVSAVPGSLQSTVVTGLTDGTTYYFAIRATHNYADPSAIYSVSPSTAPFDHLPAAFSLTGQAATDNWIDTYTPVNLTWNTASDADTGLGDLVSYTVYYSTDSSFATALNTVPVGTLKNYSADFSAYNDMTVYWYVAANDLDGKIALSAPSSSRIRVQTTNFPPNPFSLSTPTDAFICKTSTPTLTWTVSTDSAPWDVINYQVDLSTSQNFAAGISSQNIPSPSYITPPLLNNTTYWWRVWATDPLFKVMSNTTGYFRINALPVAPFAFNLSTPTDNTIFTTTTVNFSWAPTYSPDPDSSITYDISWLTHSDFSSNVIFSTGLTQTTTSYQNFMDHSIYYWYVTARCSNGLSRQSSQTTKFYTDTVQVLPSTFSLVQPGYNVIISTTLTPLFTWDAATVPNPEDEVRYTFYISPNANFTGLGTTAVNTGTDKFYVPVINLTDQTTYYWRVLAAGYIGTPWNPIPVQVDTGTYSSTSFFVISMVSHPPQNFALTSPANGTSVTTKKPLFKWGQALDTDVNAFVTYTLLVSTSSDFSSAVLNVPGITDTQYQVASALPENRTYYWKVTAISNRIPQYPTVCAANFSLRIPVLTMPQSPMGLQGALSSDRMKFAITWSPVTRNSDGTGMDDLAGYNIYRGSEQLMVLFSSVPAGTCQWTDGSMQGVEFYYRVTAVNSSGIENDLEDSPLLNSLSQDTLTYMNSDMSLVINVPAQVAKYLLAKNNPYTKDLRIKFEHNPSAETDTILSSYYIKVLTTDGVEVNKHSFEKPLTASFGYGNTTYAGKRLAIVKKAVAAASLGELSVYWNNSIEYMRMGGTPNTATQQLAINVLRTGEYQLRRVSRVSVFAVASIYPPKVFTPNIPPYETIVFYVDNPQGDKVTGKIFNLRSEYIADLTANSDATATSVILNWDGKNSNGVYVTKGVYIYQLEGSGKTINGTIMVAR